MLRVTTARLVPVAIVLAAAAGYAAAHLGSRDAVLAVAVCAVPLVPVLVLRARAAAVAAVAALPFQLSVAGALLGRLEVSVTDLLLAAAAAGLALALSQDDELRRRAARLRPLAPFVAVYLAVVLIALAAHPGWAAVVSAVQRVELVVVPLLVGAVLLTGRAPRDALTLFVAVAMVLGLFWLLPHDGTGQVLGVQKNPAGQYLVDAALLVLTALGDRRLRWLLFPALVIGVYATQSRGALVGLTVGLVVVVVLRARNPFQLLVRAVPLVLVVGSIYTVLPADDRARLRGDTSAVEYSDRVRRDYATDARALITAHPVGGVGLGNYTTGSVDDLTLTDDPHNVFLLEAAEGGYPLLVAFLVLQLGTLAVLLRVRRRTPWALPAIAVQVAVLTHSALDVYWVRGTPVLGFLLAGLALATAVPLPVPQRPVAGVPAAP